MSRLERRNQPASSTTSRPRYDQDRRGLHSPNAARPSIRVSGVAGNAARQSASRSTSSRWRAVRLPALEILGWGWIHILEDHPPSPPPPGWARAAGRDAPLPRPRSSALRAPHMPAASLSHALLPPGPPLPRAARTMSSSRSRHPRSVVIRRGYSCRSLFAPWRVDVEW